MKLLMILVMFLFLGAFFIIGNEGTHFNSFEDREIFWDYYLSWMGGLFDSGAKITGFVVNSEWLDYGNSSSEGVEVLERR